MKLILIILWFGLIIAAAGLATPEDYCVWQAKRDVLIKKLTPSGQKIFNQIMLDIQTISFAGMQPVYLHIAKKFNSTIRQLKSSNDSSKLDQLQYLFGVGNYSAGQSSLRDICQDAKNVEALVDTMSSVNQNATLQMLDRIEYHYYDILPYILSINRLLDDNLYQRLMLIEDKDTLTSLTALFFNY